jgi:BMFP domain-containing protein YqiC
MIQRTMASKEDMQALDKKVQTLDMKVTTGFECIKHLLLEDQRRKIENLEARMKKLEYALPAGRQASLSNHTQKAARRLLNGTSDPLSHPTSPEHGGFFLSRCPPRVLYITLGHHNDLKVVTQSLTQLK